MNHWDGTSWTETTGDLNTARRNLQVGIIKQQLLGIWWRVHLQKQTQKLGMVLLGLKQQI